MAPDRIGALRLAAMMLFVTMLAGPLVAQSTGTTTGDVAGRITDDKDSPLAGARVTALHRDTGACVAFALNLTAR